MDVDLSSQHTRDTNTQIQMISAEIKKKICAVSMIVRKTYVIDNIFIRMRFDYHHVMQKFCI